MQKIIYLFMLQDRLRAVLTLVNDRDDADNTDMYSDADELLDCEQLLERPLMPGHENGRLVVDSTGANSTLVNNVYPYMAKDSDDCSMLV